MHAPGVAKQVIMNFGNAAALVFLGKPISKCKYDFPCSLFCCAYHHTFDQVCSVWGLFTKVYYHYVASQAIFAVKSCMFALEKRGTQDGKAIRRPARHWAHTELLTWRFSWHERARIFAVSFSEFSRFWRDISYKPQHPFETCLWWEKWPKKMGYYFCFESRDQFEIRKPPYILNVKSHIIIFLLNSCGQEEWRDE